VEKTFVDLQKPSSPYPLTWPTNLRMW